MSTNASDVLVSPDPLISAGPPARVNYATGVLLQADDFRDEQTYHRGRLATALTYLLGHGTVAGLRAVGPAQGDNELELRVEAGVAIDRHGRLIEVTEPWCIRLARWFAAQDSSALRSAVHRADGQPIPVGIIVDLFLSLADCGRGKTPSFAQGPFDALDALIPARLGEEPAFELVLRAEPNPPGPQNKWPEASVPEAQRREAVLASYRPRTPDGAEADLPLLNEQVDGHEPSSVFLCRITIPVTLPPDSAPDQRPALDLTHQPTLDSSTRPFIYLPGKWLGAEPGA